MKHFVCKGCGNLVAMVQNSGKRLVCCDKRMDEVVPRSDDNLAEKHTPVLKAEDGKITVTVGPADKMHPMTHEHAVAWVCLVTNKGSQRKMLSPNGVAEAVFLITPDERVLKVFAYCNVHGLWVTTVEDPAKEK